MKKISVNLNILVFIFLVFCEAKGQTIINEWEGHNGPANAVLFSKDGLQLLSTGDDGTIRIFKVSDNSLQKIIQSKNLSVKKLVLSDDGTKFAVNGSDNYVEVYSYPAFDLLKTFKDTCRSVCFSSDGKKIFSCGDNFKIWDLTSGLNTKILQIPVSNCIITTKDASKVLLAGDDSKIYLYDYNSNQIIREYAEHISAILSVSLSPDGGKFASASADRTIRIWDINSTASLKIGIGHLGYVYSIAYSSDGTKLVTACEDARVRLYSTDPINILTTYWSNVGGIYSANFSPNVEKIVTAGKDGIIRLWDTKKDSYLLLESISGPTGTINNMEYSKDGYSLITSGVDNKISLWDPSLGFQLLKMSDHTDTITSLHFFKDAANAISSSVDGFVRIWNTTTGKSSVTINHLMPVYSAMGNDDGSKIFISASDSSVKVRDSKGILLKTVKNPAPARALAYSSTGNIFVSGDDLGNINIYSAADYSLKKSYKLTAKISKIVISSNADFLYAILPDKNFSVINLSTGEITNSGLSGKITDLDVSSGKIAVICEGGLVVMLLQKDIKAHGIYHYSNGYPVKAAFNPDGTLLALGGWGVNNIKILESATILAAKEPASVVNDFVLFQNYPNPFNPVTNIGFALNKKSNVSLEVYNILGEMVHKKVLENLEAGEHHISWNPGNISGGVYFYVLNNGTQSRSGKMIYLK